MTHEDQNAITKSKRHKLVQLSKGKTPVTALKIPSNLSKREREDYLVEFFATRKEQWANDTAKAYLEMGLVVCTMENENMDVKRLRLGPDEALGFRLIGSGALTSKLVPMILQRKFDVAREIAELSVEEQEKLITEGVYKIKGAKIEKIHISRATANDIKKIKKSVHGGVKLLTIEEIKAEIEYVPDPTYVDILLRKV
jgi:hypothetical protein